MRNVSIPALAIALLLSSCSSVNDSSSVPSSSSGTGSAFGGQSASWVSQKRPNRKPTAQPSETVKVPDSQKQKEFVEKSRDKLESLIMMPFSECGSEKYAALVRELEGEWKSSGGSVKNDFSARVLNCKIRASVRESKPCESTFSQESEIVECKRLSNALSIVRGAPSGLGAKTWAFAIYAQYFGDARDFPPEKFALQK